MDLLEYQGKQLFAEAGLPVQPGVVATTAEEAERAAAGLGYPVAVKAQVKIGGRGKAGGIQLCDTAEEVASAAEEILAMTISGHAVSAVLVEPAVKIAREFYLAISLSRAQRGPLLLFSAKGGVDIETVAREYPEAVVRRAVDPLLGLCDYQVRDVVAASGLGHDVSPAGQKLTRELASLVHSLWALYRDRDATLVEINPLVLTEGGELLCLDSKVTIDDSALFRQHDVDAGAPSEQEARAREVGLAFVPLEGDIGVVGNGAGLVMSTLDRIAAAGGAAADFCDLGGGADAARVAAALELVLSCDEVNALLVTVFGGITRCDEVAHGLVNAFNGRTLEVPVVVRLEGNAAAEGRSLLAAARLNGVTLFEDAGAAVAAAVAAAAEHRRLSREED